MVARRSRDHGAGLSTPWRYMIDASVFLPLERCHQRAPQHAVAFYNHAWVTPLRLWRSDGTLPPLNGPVRRNNIPVNSVVDLICSARTLVTSSYHGALWALLAGRMVVIAQRADYASSKLFLMEHGERVPHVQVYRRCGCSPVGKIGFWRKHCARSRGAIQNDGTAQISIMSARRCAAP